MQNIIDFIVSEYEAYHYSSDEMIETNNKLIKWLEESNEQLKEQWGE